MDTLQNIEFVIVNFDRASEDLTDLEVKDVLEYLIRSFTARANGRSAPFVRFSEAKKELAKGITLIGDLRIGGTTPAIETAVEIAQDADDDEMQDGLAIADELLTHITIEEFIECLRRLKRSVELWNATKGRRGYLEYVREFIV